MDNYPMHSFSFDARHDSPDIEVLDYQYGNTRQVGTSANKEMISLGEAFPSTSIFGPMPRGEFLFVKWRIKKTGAVHQDRVDLTTRLPPDITHHAIHFAIKGGQLYVYLIPPPGIWPDLALRPYAPAHMAPYLRLHQIYPDQQK